MGRVYKEDFKEKRPEKKHDLQCHKCNYVWRTKYNKIPAKCPSCGKKIFGTNNYSFQ